MKQIIGILAFVLTSLTVSAQTDTVAVAALDSTLCGVSVFHLLSTPGADGAKVTVNQSASVADAFAQFVEQNPQHKRNGYRIRIYISNSQNARRISQEVEESFKEIFPAIPTYRSSSNPYFKVTVGNYRNRSDAAYALELIRLHYPTAFVVKEHIEFPAL